MHLGDFKLGGKLGLLGCWATSTEWPPWFTVEDNPGILQGNKQNISFISNYFGLEGGLISTLSPPENRRTQIGSFPDTNRPRHGYGGSGADTCRSVVLSITYRKLGMAWSCTP